VANNDLEFDSALAIALEHGVRHLVSHPETYLCGFNDAITAGSAKVAPVAAGSARVVATVSGCLMLFRSSLFRRIGLMSEGYFMYGEENDYFDRMRRHGLELVLIDSPIRHAGEGSRLPGIRTTWLAHRNSLRRAIKTFELSLIARTVGSLVVMPWFRRRSAIQSHLSLMRTLRFGRLVGSILGLASIGWNIVNLRTAIRERIAEDELIKLSGKSVMD
jgi:GT2 family glycosyltransferase